MRLYIFFKGLPHYRVPFLRRLAESLPRGWELVVFAGSYESPRMSGFNLYEAQEFELRQDKGLSFGRAYLHLGFLREALFGKGDVYVIPGNQGFLAAYIGLPLLRLRRKKALIWTKGLAGGALERVLVAFSRGVITYSRTSEEYFRARYRKPVYVAQNTVDTEALASQAEELRRRGLEFWEGKPKPWLAYVGRFTEEKDPILLVEAFKLFKEGHLAMVGRGPLLEEARRRGKGLPITFTGFLRPERALPIVAAADLFVQPGYPGLATLEAMALGTPPVIPDVVWPEAEPVRDGKTGYRFSFGDPESLARTLKRAWEDARRPEVGKSAQNTVVSQWSIDAMVKGFLKSIL